MYETKTAVTDGIVYDSAEHPTTFFVRLRNKTRTLDERPDNDIVLVQVRAMKTLAILTGLFVAVWIWIWA
jgi:hypothetical protein